MRDRFDIRGFREVNGNTVVLINHTETASVGESLDEGIFESCRKEYGKFVIGHTIAVIGALYQLP